MVVQLSSKKFLLLCAVLATVLFGIGMVHPFSPLVIGAEVLLTILSLFVFGSAKYQIHKNALTYGAVLVIGATFFPGWWPESGLKAALASEGPSALFSFLATHLLTLHGLDELVHADTMLFILGLTLFVSVIAQTRMLENISFSILSKMKGYAFPTVALLTGLVAFSSGILDGVSMIGLMIRTMVIILFLAKADDEAIIFAVIVSTVVTTVCGMWLAYGEPPNLIMKANLHPLLTNGFFLRYCLPAAVASYLVVLFNVSRKLKGRRVHMDKLDVLDQHTADLRFLQAVKHGEVLTPIEFLEEHKEIVGDHFEALIHRLHKGEPLGEALVDEKVSTEKRRSLLERFSSAELAVALDEHYVALAAHKETRDNSTLVKIRASLADVQKQRVRTQVIGSLAFIPFVGLLIAHGVDHEIPLFLASFAGFVIALFGVWGFPKMKRLAIHEAKLEYAEYYFLFPLFLSITLLQRSGFFDIMTVLLHQGIEKLGVFVVAYIQYAAACVLSALLDNNIVADFASRALHGLDKGVLHLFSMAQIAGYAAGGCWTHIGSAQSVVAFAFIRREINETFSPFRWIKLMTPIILEISLVMMALIYAESVLLRYLG